MLRRLSFAATFFSAMVIAFGAGAQARPGEITVPAGGGQPLLGTRFIENALYYKACPQSPCVPGEKDSAVSLPLGTGRKEVQIDVLSIGSDHHVLFAHSARWGALIAALPDPSLSASVLWTGGIGFVRGEEGERTGGMVSVTPSDAAGEVEVLVGEIREDVTICGRPSILSPKLLDARDLGFESVRLQRLSREERDRATSLTARPGSPSLGGVGSILRASAASSAIGNPSALTDGNIETTWAENRGGDGNGEFVQINAPEQVDIKSLSIVARPMAANLPKGAGPRKVWLATHDDLFAVTFPEDPWAHPGGSYDVTFPAPIKTSCLAIVLDEAYVRPNQPNPDVTLAEITAHTELDGSAGPAALAGALAGGQERARMAAAILATGGDAASDAVIKAYPTLDDAGRLLALDVIDNAPCARSAPLYVLAAQLGKPGEAHHADDRLVRCGRDAAPSLIAALGKGPEPQRSHAARVLALVAPDEAVTAIVPLLASASSSLRTEYRAALARAAESSSASGAIAQKLADTTLPKIAAIDLLRATAQAGAANAAASPALVRLAEPSAEFRTRYLLLGPAAALAQSGDGRAEKYLISALSTDSDPHVRARAADAAAQLPAAIEPLARALDDADVRVRDAALVSLAAIAQNKQLGAGAPVVPTRAFATAERLLADDLFTFVRADAAHLLVAAPPGEEADQALAKALSDVSPVVRGRAVEVLGERGSIRHAADIRKRLEDEAETTEVQVRAARALGRVCDRDSVELLTDLAQAPARTGMSGSAVLLASSAAAALGRLHPPDLPKRLSPLMDAGAPRVAHDIAGAALATSDRCR